MSILPQNKPHTPHYAPRNFFIWGATMSGKSYLASAFPDSIVFSTDDNEKNSGTRPGVPIKNTFDSKGNIVTSAIDILDKYILALGTEPNTFKTVVIDVIEDVCTLIDRAICAEYHVKFIGDVPYGKGWGLFDSMLQELVMDLKALPMNVIYISRENSKMEDGQVVAVPALKQKYYNVVNGNCDLVIRTQHLGKSYIRTVTDIRRKYKQSEIDDPQILRILMAIPGALIKDVPAQTTTTNKDGK